MIIKRYRLPTVFAGVCAFSGFFSCRRHMYHLLSIATNYTGKVHCPSKCRKMSDESCRKMVVGGELSKWRWVIVSSWYDTAQICLNGHVINSMVREYPHRNQKFCDGCGAPTITTCQKCNTSIKGELHVEGVIAVSYYNPPNYCHNCGEPYPWTEENLKAAKELADEIDQLSSEEKEILKKSLDDIVKETPRTTVAVTRFKKLMSKTGPEIIQGFKSLLTDIVSETVKKALWPN